MKRTNEWPPDDMQMSQIGEIATGVESRVGFLANSSGYKGFGKDMKFEFFSKQPAKEAAARVKKYLQNQAIVDPETINVVTYTWDPETLSKDTSSSGDYTAEDIREILYVSFGIIVNESVDIIEQAIDMVEAEMQPELPFPDKASKSRRYRQQKKFEREEFTRNLQTILSKKIKADKVKVHSTARETIVNIGEDVPSDIMFSFEKTKDGFKGWSMSNFRIPEWGDGTINYWKQDTEEGVVDQILSDYELMKTARSA